VLRVNSAVGQQRIAKPSHRGAHYIQLIINLSVGGEFFVLHDHRHIVDAPLLRQAQQAAFIILNQYQPGEPHRHLMPGFAVLMGMEPAGGRPLIRGKGHCPLATGFNDAVRATVHLARYFQTVPVNGGLFIEGIVDIDGQRFSLA